MSENNSLVHMVNQWPASRKLSIVALVAICAILFAVVILQSKSAGHSLLYANLASEDAAEVIDWLSEHKIPFTLKDGGASVYIPGEKLYEVRVQMAGDGLPQGGGVGYEIFDKQGFGTTDFTQKINQQRALQGELARTISALRPVESARVHLVIPAKRAFQKQQQKTTASVYIKMQGAKVLSEEQIQSVIHLVSSSVAGLDRNSVTIIDSNGRLLSKPKSNDRASAGSTTLEHQKAVEKSLEERAQSILDKAVGYGNSEVRVTATLDFAQIDQRDEIFNPDLTAVRSENLISEKSATQSPGGVAGARANMGGGSSTGNNASTSKTSETTNFEVSKTVKHTVKPVGDIRTLSVSVVVSDEFVAKEGEVDPKKVNLQDIENIIRTAIGIDETRGDKINVAAMPFNNPVFVDNDTDGEAIPEVLNYLPFIRYGMLGIGALLLYMMFMRPLIRTLSGKNLTEHPFKTASEIENEIMGPKEEKNKSKGSLINPLPGEVEDTQKGAQIIKGWLKEG